MQTREDDYRRALESCATTAAKECRYARDAIDRTRALLRDLQHQADATGAGSSACRPGTAVTGARSQLAETAQRLNADTSKTLKTAPGALERKKARLSEFTVALFGRTMVGKSTIREAITHGDGKSIGKGARRTTRHIREYDWNQLRIIDTPGICAYEEEEDRALALSVIGESDVLLFVTSSDGVRESSFRGMQELSSRNKPVIFVLNVRLDLTRPVHMRRFLGSPESVLGEQKIQGHLDRIRQLAAGKMRMRRVDIVPIHAQAAFLATRPKYSGSADALHGSSGIDRLLQVLTLEVRQRGPVRRAQTILAGTAIHLMDLEKSLRREARSLDRNASYLKDKFTGLEVRLKEYFDAIPARIRGDASEKLRPLRKSVSSFVDNNIEKENVDGLWKSKVKKVKIKAWIIDQKKQIIGGIAALAGEFTEEVKVELELGGAFTGFTAGSPGQY